MRKAILTGLVVVMACVVGCSMKSVYVVTVGPEKSFQPKNAAEMIKDLESTLPKVDRTIALGEKGDKRMAWLVCGSAADRSAVEIAIEGNSRWKVLQVEEVLERKLKEYLADQAKK